MWNVYILKCNDGSLYTGITTDIDKRLKVHNQGKGSRYTRTRRPVNLIYFEEIETKGQALKREIEIKSFSLNNKLNLCKFGLGHRFSLAAKHI